MYEESGHLVANPTDAYQRYEKKNKIKIKHHTKSQIIKQSPLLKRSTLVYNPKSFAHLLTFWTYILKYMISSGSTLNHFVFIMSVMFKFVLLTKSSYHTPKIYFFNYL